MESLAKDYVFISSTKISCDNFVFCKTSLTNSTSLENIYAETLTLCNQLVSEHEVLVTPHCLTRGQFGILVLRKNYDTQFLHLLDKMNAAVLTMTEAQPFHIESCLRFAVTRRMGTDWTCIGPWIVHCPTLSQLDEEKVHAIEFNLRLQGDGKDAFFEVVAKTSKMKFHLISPEDINPDEDQLNLLDNDPDWIISFQDAFQVYCFPHFNQAQVIQISRNVPPWSPLKTYDDFVTYWKDLYCYQLPLVEDGQVYFTVKFSRNGAQYVYPSCCLCSRPPTMFRDDANEPQAALKLFLRTLTANFAAFFKDLQVPDIVLHTPVASLETASQLPSTKRNLCEAPKAGKSKVESALKKRRLTSVPMLDKLVEDLDKERARSKPTVSQPTVSTTLISPYFNQGCSTEKVSHIPSILLARTKAPGKKLTLLDCQTAKQKQQQQHKSKPYDSRGKSRSAASVEKTLKDFFPVKKTVSTANNDLVLLEKEKTNEMTGQQKYDVVNLALHGQLSKVPLAVLQKWLKKENIPYFIKAKREELIQLITKHIRDN